MRGTGRAVRIVAAVRPARVGVDRPGRRAGAQRRTGGVRRVLRQHARSSWPRSTTPYEASSVFLCVIDHRRLVPAGVSRVDRSRRPPGSRASTTSPGCGTRSRRTRSTAPAPRIDLDRCHDVATLATTAEYRGAASEGLVSLALYQAIIMSALASGRPWLVAVMDVAVHRPALRAHRLAVQPLSRHRAPELSRLAGQPAGLRRSSCVR